MEKPFNEIPDINNLESDVESDQETLEQKVDIIEFPNLSEGDLVRFFEIKDRFNTLIDTLDEKSLREILLDNNSFAVEMVKKYGFEEANSVLLHQFVSGSSLPRTGVIDSIKTLDLPNNEIENFFNEIIQKYGGS
jgi:hypothetical protein